MIKYFLIVFMFVPTLSFAVEVESCQMLGDIAAFTAQLRDSGMSHDTYVKFVNTTFKNSKYKSVYLHFAKDVFILNKKTSATKFKDDIRTLCNFSKFGIYDDKEK